MPAQEKKLVEHPFEAAKAQAPEAHAASAADNPMLRWLFSGGLTGLTQGLPFLHGMFSKDDGTTSLQRGGGVGWAGSGPKASIESSRKIAGDENHALEMGWALGYADGNVSAQRSTGGKMLADDGAKLADAKSKELAVGKDGVSLKSHAESSRKLGDDETKQSTDYAVGYGPKGPTGSLAKSEEHKDGANTTKKSAGASYDGKDLAINANVSRQTHLDDNHQMGSSTGATLKNGRATFSHDTNWRSSDPDLTGVVNSSKTQNEVGFGKGGVSAQRSTTDTTEVNGETFTDTKSHGYKDGQVTRTSGHSRTYKDEDGNERTDSRGTSYGVSTSGANVGYSNETKVKDGGSSANAVNAGVDWEKGEASVSAGHKSTNKDGRELSVGGGATVDSHGNLTGANVNAGFANKEGTSVSVSGKYSVEAGKPKAKDGVFIVAWSRNVSGGASAGKQGGHAGVSAKAELSHQDHGTRVFHSQKEADLFAANAASMIPTDQPSPATVEGALALQIGESRGESDGHKVGASVTGKAGIVTAGVGAEKGSSHGTTVERVSPNLFQVTLDNADTQGKSGQFGAFGMDAGGYTESGTSNSLTVQFDLSTDVGRKTFEEFNRTHKPPKKGGAVISQTQAEQQRHGTRLNFGPAGSASFNSSTWDSTTHDANGKTEVHGGAYDQSIISNIPFMKGHDNMGISLAGIEHNDRDRSYILQGTVDSTDGEASRHNLAQITGMRYDASDDAKHGVKSSGKWRVDVNFSAEMADDFMKNIQSEKVRDVSIFESRQDDRNNLRIALKAAKTSDDRMKAIARFVGEGGFQGESMDIMRQQLFGQAHSGLDNHFLGNFDYDLMLPNDKNFRGAQGRVELEHKLAGYQALMTSEASRAPLVGSLQGELEDLRRQRAEIADPKRYTDLPEELRAQQLQKLDNYIETVRGMRQSAALAATKLNPGQAPDKDAAADQEGAIPAGGDPKLAELRRMRHLISSTDTSIEDFQYRYDTAQRELSDLAKDGEAHRIQIEHRRQYDAVRAGTTGAREMQAAAQAQLRAVEDLRVQFILAMNKPDEALALGNQLLAAIKRSEAIMEHTTSSFDKEVEFLAGETDMEEEEAAEFVLHDGAGTHYFRDRAEWDAYNREKREKKQARP